MRLVLEWFSANRTVNHPLSFDETATWFSEARLASTFLPRYRGDTYAEGYTHADGVIGHFEIGRAGQADLTVLPDATELEVVEAKMFSNDFGRLSQVAIVLARAFVGHSVSLPGSGGRLYLKQCE